ncbi:uncharacterized protein LOC114673596 [Macaca mulatta]
MGLGLGLGLGLLGLELELELGLELGRAGARAGAGAGAVGRGRCDSRLRGCDAGRRVRAGRRRPGLGECVSRRPGGGARISCPAPPTARARSPPGRCQRGRHLAGEARAARCEGWAGRPPAPRLLFVQARRPEDQPRPRLSRERLGVARAAPVPGCAPALERGRRPGRCLRRGECGGAEWGAAAARAWAGRGDSERRLLQVRGRPSRSTCAAAAAGSQGFHSWIVY